MEELWSLFILTALLISLILHIQQKRVILKNNNEDIKDVPFLFSWSSLLVGFFVPLIRGDIKWFFIYLIIGIFTAGLGVILLAFFYNKIYIKSLLQKGYKPANHDSEQLLINANIIDTNIIEKKESQDRLQADIEQENKLYEKVWDEISNGIKDKALWAKAYANGVGSEEKTKALYITYRVEALKIQEKEKKEIYEEKEEKRKKIHEEKIELFLKEKGLFKIKSISDTEYKVGHYNSPMEGVIKYINDEWTIVKWV
jgi:hypothetical protein